MPFGIVILSGRTIVRGLYISVFYSGLLGCGRKGADGDCDIGGMG
jgi:hypothetical protein